MLEQIIHGILLALHNIALVGCAAAPFYNRNLVTTRAQYGPKLHGVGLFLKNDDHQIYVDNPEGVERISVPQKIST